MSITIKCDDCGCDIGPIVRHEKGDHFEEFHIKVNECDCNHEYDDDEYYSIIEVSGIVDDIERIIRESTLKLDKSILERIERNFMEIRKIHGLL